MSQDHTFQEIIDITRQSIIEFTKVEQRPWGIEGSMIELSKQVGDLSKHIMVQEKFYLAARENDPKYITTKEKIADELSDIFFCLVRIADHYSINLESACYDTRVNDLKELKGGN